MKPLNAASAQIRTQKQIFPHRSKETGMTLLEVMVAAAVIGFGLLGVAGLQLSTMKIATSSLARSQVVMLTEFIADRIRTNPGGASTYMGMSCDASECNKTTLASCDESACSSADIAALDAEQWRQELASAASFLSAVTGTLARDANNVWTIRIFWDDSDIYGEDTLNRDAASTLDCIPQSATNKASLQCYQIRLML
jgi:type IV pilus assembly protein PilV